MNRKEGQLAGARGEIDGGSKALKNAETQIAILRGEYHVYNSDLLVVYIHVTNWVRANAI